MNLPETKDYIKINLQIKIQENRTREVFELTKI